jgi:hypothetical protein
MKAENNQPAGVAKNENMAIMAEKANENNGGNEMAKAMA